MMIFLKTFFFMFMAFFCAVAVAQYENDDIIIDASDLVPACKDTPPRQANKIHVTAAAKAVRCFSEPANLKSASSPEAALGQTMASISDEEAAARLVFAESLASGCRVLASNGPPDLAAIPKGIAWVIRNRASSKPLRSVVFEKQQFRSSTGDCDVARRKEFLCPSSAGAGWEKLWQQSLAAVRSPEKDLTGGAKNYFFPHHFDQSKTCARWKGIRPDWAKKKPKAFPARASCLEIF